MLGVDKYDGVYDDSVMKVTALIPDELVQDVKALSHGKNITEALVIALCEWRAAKQLQAMNRRVQSRPLQFRKDFSAEKIRKLNRRR